MMPMDDKKWRLAVVDNAVMRERASTLSSWIISSMKRTIVRLGKISYDSRGSGYAGLGSMKNERQ
jgi:hypothetical protein